MHVRRIHYFLVSRADIKKPDGKPYENTAKDWDFLTAVAKWARYLGLVSVDNFIDRRNPEPHFGAFYWENQNVDEILANLNVGQIAEAVTGEILPYNPQHVLAYHLEIWAEKSTQNDILLPIARQYRANLVTGLGELSITAVNQLIQRIQQADKPARIFYISDFDPAGENMPVSISRKIEYLIRSISDLKNIKLKPLMLTKQQCIDYQLPRTPIKKDDRRKGSFEERHGDGATELDALEALHPGEMGKMLCHAINRYVDIESYNAVLSENSRIRQVVEDALRKQLKDVLSDFSLGYESDFEMPEAGLIAESDDWLFDSKLSYGEQLLRYKRHKE